MEIKVAGKAVVINSGLKVEDINKVEKFRPEALVLFEEADGHKEPMFAIDALDDEHGCINQFGASFVKDENGFATVTMLVDNEVPDVKKFVAEELGGALAKLKVLAPQVEAAAKAVADEQAAIIADIKEV